MPKRSSHNVYMDAGVFYSILLSLAEIETTNRDIMIAGDVNAHTYTLKYWTIGHIYPQVIYVNVIVGCINGQPGSTVITSVKRKLNKVDNIIKKSGMDLWKLKKNVAKYMVKILNII